MITRLSVKGFKTLRDVDIPLKRVSVVVGPNNCGKSNVLRALVFISDIVTGGFDGALTRAGGRDAVATRGGPGVMDFEVEATLGDTEYRYRVASSAPGFPAGYESLSTTGAWGFSTMLMSDGTAGLPNNGRLGQGAMPGDIIRQIYLMRDMPEPARRFAVFLAGITLADFSMDRLRSPSRATPSVSLQSTGENLAAVLDRLDGDQPVVRGEIEREVLAAVPGVTRLVTPTVDDKGNKVVGIAEGNNVFRSSEISDGILLFIALSTVTQLSGGKTLVCLEEPDKGIHPRRLREVLEQINRVAKKGSQFVLTTHSPVLLNEFRDEPEAVLILDREGDSTRVRQLSTLPDVQEQMRDVSLGELWYSGVLGGVPPK